MRAEMDVFAPNVCSASSRTCSAFWGLRLYPLKNQACDDYAAAAAAASCLNKCPASHKLHIFIQLSSQSGLRRSPTPLRAATMVYWRGASTYLNRMAVDEFRRCVQRHGRRQQAAALSPPLAAALPPAARRRVSPPC